MKLTVLTGVIFVVVACLSGCSSDSSDKGTGGSTSGGTTSGGDSSGGGSSSTSTQVCCINKRFYKCATAADCEKNLEADVCPADSSQDSKCAD
jgi:hypothetical protein